MLKLLKRNTATLEIQSQRRKQIEEGINLAQKIDALRLMLADLEQQHSKFIANIQVDLEEKTRPLVQKIASLKWEIEVLEDKKKSLTIPLDKEWAEVNKIKSGLTKTEESLAKREVLVAKKEENQITIGKDLKEKTFKINTIEREAEKFLSKTKENLFISEENKKEAIKQKEESDEYVKNATQFILTREAEVSVKEREIGILKKQTDDREEGLNVREAQINSRYRTLLKAEEYGKQ